MLFEKIRNYFWLAAMENRDIDGIKIWKRIARGDTGFKMVDTIKTGSDISLYNMRCELTHAVNKGSLARLNHIFNAHPKAFIAHSSSGYEEEIDGHMSMTITPVSRVKSLISVAEKKGYDDLASNLKLMASKVDNLVRKEPIVRC